MGVFFHRVERKYIQYVVYVNFLNSTTSIVGVVDILMVYPYLIPYPPNVRVALHLHYPPRDLETMWDNKDLPLET